jgi:hypothetical protein
MAKASDIQYVEFALGQAVLTPPIAHGGQFLVGERITLGGEAFVVTQDQTPPTDGKKPPKGKVRRIPVVAAAQWRGAWIDREFNWPAAPRRKS